MSDPGSIVDLEKLAAVVTDAHLLELADAIPVHDGSDGGRPRAHHLHTILVFHVVAQVLYQGRIRQAVRELGYGPKWQHICDLIRDAFPHRSDIWPTPDLPVKRHHYHYARETHLATDESLRLAQSALERSGAELARRLCLLGREEGSWTQPTPESAVFADGKVIRAASTHTADPVVDSRTGEIRVRRHDPDVSLHTKGDGRKAIGHRVVIAGVRSPTWRGRAILGVEDSASGSEIEALAPLMSRICTELDPKVLLYDGALRGAHIDEFARELGILCVAPPAPKRTDRRGGARAEHEVLLGAYKVVGPGGTRSIDIWAVGGAACERHVRVDGEVTYVRLGLSKIERREPRTPGGRFRFYGQYETSGGETVRLPLYVTSEDTTRKLNRTEYHRPFPPESPQFLALYGRRADAESANRQLEDCLWQKRAGSYGRRRVLFDTVGWALGENAIAEFIRLRDASPPGAVAA